MNKTNDRISPDVIAVDIEKLSAILSCGCATARKNRRAGRGKNIHRSSRIIFGKQSSKIFRIYC